MTDLARRLARYGLTLTPGEQTTHGERATLCVCGLGAPAWFGSAEILERWIAAHLTAPDAPNEEAAHADG